MRTIEADWKQALSFVELAVEDVPILAPNRTSQQIPLASLVPGTATTLPRIVLFRRPIESRAKSTSELKHYCSHAWSSKWPTSWARHLREVYPNRKVTD
jgi:hypothetical protein